MHSETLADHDLMNAYLDKRQAQCVSEDERGDMKGVIEFEQKHRMSLLHPRTRLPLLRRSVPSHGCKS
jgi:hypothetical protein